MTSRSFSPTDRPGFGESQGAGPSADAHTIRLGAISFVNTVPIYGDYRPDADISLVYDVPARLNARLLGGELEISPVSSACYLRNQDRLLLLDDLSVSSPGAVESVIFLSSQPLGSALLDGSVISVPDDSETSIMLLAYLLKEAVGQDMRPWFQSYAAADYRRALAETGNALVIGDNALLVREAGVPEGIHLYDLSSLWKSRTGLPFVFAVWVADQAWAARHPERLEAVAEGLRASRNRFFAEPSIFETGIALAQSRSVLPRGTLERYYRQCLTYGLTPEHRASLDLFDTIIQSADQWAAPGRPNPVDKGRVPVPQS